jgi:hypothetical protein
MKAIEVSPTLQMDRNVERELVNIAIKYEHDPNKQEEEVNKIASRGSEPTFARRVFRALFPLTDESTKIRG